MSLKAALVVTTINDPVVLIDYAKNFADHGHTGDVVIYMIPDRKTPAAAYETVRTIRERGQTIVCPDFDEQEAYLTKLGLDGGFIPYNSDNRRNIGYLMAYESGADFIISIDDDNFPDDPQVDIFKEHAIVCDGPRPAELLKSSDNLLNICGMLEFETAGPVYPRGYPYHSRHKPQAFSTLSGQADVHVNAGLWVSHPDIDGISWLVNPPRATSAQKRSVVLDKSCWTPINTQNTGLNRQCMPAYYFIKMGYPLGGTAIDRYGDIFSGYFVEACAKHLDAGIRVGSPVAEHRRNSHNYMNDAANEWACIQLLEDLVPWLVDGAGLSGSTYSQAYLSLAALMDDQVERFGGKVWTEASKGYFHSVAYHMRKWLQACGTIEGSPPRQFK